MADLTLDRGLDVLAGRTRAVRILIYLVMAFGVGQAMGELLEAVGLADTNALAPDGISASLLLLYLGFTASYLVSIVVVCMWIYRAHANAGVVGVEKEFSPGWAVGWFFIPIMNLFKPFQAMRELWNSSHLVATNYSDEASNDVKIWWGCFIVSNILANISVRLNGWTGETANPTGLAIGCLSSLLTVACAWYLLRIVNVVDRAQRSNMTAADVFA